MRDLSSLLLSSALALLLSSWPACGSASWLRRERHLSGDWRLVIVQDAFSGRVVCRLGDRSKRAFYEGGAIGFRFGQTSDVAAAVYKVDRGHPQAWRDDLPELLAIGTPVDVGGTVVPMGGVVRVPWRRLAAARSVSIQPRSGERPRVFLLAGARDLLERARKHGCVPDARFIP